MIELFGVRISLLLPVVSLSHSLSQKCVHFTNLAPPRNDVIFEFPLGSEQNLAETGPVKKIKLGAKKVFAP